MLQLPLYVCVTFVLTTLLTIWLFYRATHRSKRTLIVLVVWMIGQTVLGLLGFYEQPTAMPPRFPVLVLPPLLLIAGLFLTRRGRRFVDQLAIGPLTWLHTIRIPVEMVLFWLFVGGVVPQVMTFEGRNFDIVAGLSAPLVYYFAFVRKIMPRSVLIIWNLICLGLLLNIVITAALAVPSPFQKLAFGQPNRAILYFPFVWLPSVVVPIVLLAHLSALRQLGKTVVAGRRQAVR